MALLCEHCKKSFPTNASLYKHKYREHNKSHNKSSLVLVSHNHRNMASNPKKRVYPPDDPNAVRLPPKRYRNNNRPRSDKKKSPTKDPQYDDGLVDIDQYKDPGEKPRDSDPRKHPNYESQSDDGLEIIDRYKDLGEKAKDSDPPKSPKINPQSNDGLKIVDEYKADDESDDQLSVVDSYDDDGQSDGGLTVIDEYDDRDQARIKPSVDYKKKYLNCLEAHEKQESKFLKKIDRMDVSHKKDLERTKREYRKECYDEIEKIKNFHRRQMSDLDELLKSECSDKIQALRAAHNELIQNMANDHKKQLDKNEEDCERKLRTLNDQIKAMQKDDEDLSSLSKAIFNCTTMEEIFEIQKLIKNHQLDIVVQNHLPTLQNLFLSLSYGVLPICQPQREQVTDDQRRVVEKIQSASGTSAKRILKEKHSEIVNLFTIIKDSIKLARDSYNRYGIVP